MKTKEQRTALRDAILAVAEAAAELAVNERVGCQGPYESQAQTRLYRAEDRLDAAIDDIFGVSDD